MTKHITTKPKTQPLIHHPSDVLDRFCRYDESNDSWLEFNDSLSGQLAQFEAEHRQYIRVRLEDRRRTIS